jgi:dolichol-phosphate mannosyltransferase
MSIKKTISLIIPCYNESENIEFCYDALIDLWQDKNLKKYELEIIYIDDGSHDDTLEKMYKLAKKDNRVKVLEFSRNFGKEIATTAGKSFCSGDCCITLDVDLQYPVEKIPEFVEKWEKGADVVVGIRDKKKTNNLIEKIGSYWFYKILNLISQVEVLPGALDFRLLDRKVIDEFNKLTERGRMTRALIDWLGFKREYVHYTENHRLNGTSTYSFFKRITLTLYTFVAHSLLPLRLAGYLGVIITFVSGFIGFFALINQYILDTPLENFIFSGPFLVGILSVFLNGIVLSCLGLVALYIASIHTEVNNRPLFIVRSKKNFEE